MRLALLKTIVLKPTMACNLNCSYCYEARHNGGRYLGARFEAETLSGWIRRFATTFPHSKILWMLHGGEPTITGVKFFRAFTTTLRELNATHDVEYKLALQTNATLLNDEWIAALEDAVDLMSERNISVSIDGTREINDAARLDHQQRSSFDAIMNSMRLISDSSLHYSTITVVARHNVSRAEEVYSFIKSCAPDFVKFIPCYNYDADGEAEMLGINPIEYADFIRQIFDLWMHDGTRNDGRDFVIDPIATIISNLVDTPVTWCEYRDSKCDNFTSIYPDGSLWLCDTFRPDTMRAEAYLGKLDELDDDELRASFLEPKMRCEYESMYSELTNNCRACDVFDVCHAGCLPQRADMKAKNTRLFREYCVGKHRLINHIKAGVERALS